VKKLRIIAGLVLALFIGGGAGAAGNRTRVSLGADYDLDSGTYVYPITTGESDMVLSGPRQRRVPVQTVGSSTTVAAATATTAPFQGIVVGDEVYFNVQGVAGAGLGGTQTSRVITAKASDDSVTVDTAIDLSTAQNFSWRRFAAAGTAADGWVPMAGFDAATFIWQMKQSDGASIDVKVECRMFSSPATDVVQIVTTNVTAYGCPGTGCQKQDLNPSFFDQCRLGFKINTDTSDAGAAVEKISAQFVGVAEP
jgi:hypothetical protein